MGSTPTPALQVGQCSEFAVFVLSNHDLPAGNGARLGKIEYFLALFRDADLIDDNVVRVGLQTGQHGTPFTGAELGIHAHLAGQMLSPARFRSLRADLFRLN